MKQKILCLFIIVLLLMTSTVFAADENRETILNVIKSEGETKQLENNNGTFSKKIVNSNPSTGEVNIEVTLQNSAADSSSVNNSTEIFLVIDNSTSMDYVTDSGSIRKDLIMDASEKLVNSILDVSENTKIGLIRFKGASVFDFGTTIDDATLVTELTDNKDTLLQGINSISETETGSGTNIDAGLQRAYDNFSADAANKIIVLLTDGLPTCDIYGTIGTVDNDGSKATEIQEHTKATIEELAQSNTYIISMFTGLDSSSDTYETDLAAITNIFGTEENPTAGEFYNISDANIDTIVTNDIYNNIINTIEKPMKSIEIIDYFPDDILNHFEITATSENATFSETDTAIKLNKDILNSGEELTILYTLKIKDMNNSELIGKTLNTNNNVTLTYLDYHSQSHTVTLSDSPQIQLNYVGVDPNPPTPDDDTNTNPDPIVPGSDEDPTLAPDNLPATGLGKVLITLLLITIISLIIVKKKYNSYKDIK